MPFGRIWIVLLVECPAATTYFIFSTARICVRVGDEDFKVTRANRRTLFWFTGVSN